MGKTDMSFEIQTYGELDANILLVQMVDESIDA